MTMQHLHNTLSRSAAILGLVFGLCCTAHAAAQGLSAAPAAIVPQGAAPLTNRALTQVRGKGASNTPAAQQQLAVILWDERGTPKATDASYGQSVGAGNSQSNSLSQN